MTTPNKENVAATPRTTVDMNNPQDVARMLTGGYGLSGEGFHYHSFTRPVMLDVTPDLPSEYEDDTQHHLDDNVTEYSSVPAAEPEPVAEPVHTPVAPPVIAEIAPAPPPPSPPPPPAPPPPPPAPPAPPPHTPVAAPAPAPHQPEVVVDVPVPEPVVEAARAQVFAAPEKPQSAPSAQVAPAPSADTAAAAGRERRGLQPFATPPATPAAAATPPRAASPGAPTVQADDWAPVPKAQQRRGQRPTGPGFFFAKGNDRVVTARLFQPVAVARPAPKPATKVTTMTKFDKNAQNNPVGRRSAPSDNSPTLTEVFMTLGGRATDRLVPKPSLRDALLRKREEENGQS